jgi:EmrB/QacA subfamily drug resistance transporter
VLAVLCLGQSVVLLDTTVVNVAIPAIINGLPASLDQILWVINGYILTYAALLITAGRLGDLYGPKRLFLVGLALFAAASVGCGLAQDPGQLIAARVAQGIGGALLTPQSLSMITQVFPAGRRGAAFGVWGSVAGIAAAAGPTVGGLLVATLGWRWVFYVNLPIGLAGIALGAAVLPELGSGRRHRLDLVGTALVSVALFLLAYGLIEGEPRHWGQVWGPVTVPMLMVGGLLVLCAFWLVERQRQGREPLLPFAVLRDRNFALMAFVVAALPCGLGAMLFLTLIYLQSALGMGAFAAGATVAAAPLVSVFVAPTAGRLIDRFGGKYVLVAGFGLFAAGIGYIGAVAAVDSTWLDLLPGLLVFGVGMGVAASPAAVVAMRDIEPSMSGAASGVFNTTRLCGSLLGSAAVGALLQARLAVSLPAASSYAAGLTAAVRVSYLLPVAVLLLAALVTLGVRERRPAAQLPPPEPSTRPAAVGYAGPAD